MDRRQKASVLWGLVGALAFLVLVQGYELLGGPGIGMGAKFAVALGVGIGATGLAYVAEGRLYDDASPDDGKEST